jgi:hypothetical protein
MHDSTGRQSRLVTILSIVGACLTAILLAYVFPSDSVDGFVLANTLVTPTWVMKEIARRLVNNWVFANQVNRD